MSNPYAAPASTIASDDIVEPLMDGQPFRIEGETLVCRSQVDLSDFCFYLGEDVSQKLLVNEKMLKAADGRSQVTKLVNAIPLLLVLPMCIAPRLPLWPLGLICLTVWGLFYKQLVQGVKIHCIVSSDGEALRNRATLKNKIRDGFACTVLYVVLLYVGWLVMGRLNWRPYYLSIAVSSALSALTVHWLKKWLEVPGTKWGPPKAEKLNDGMYRVLDLPTNLVRAYAAQELVAEECLAGKQKATQLPIED